MKVADHIVMAWLLAVFLCAVLSPFVFLGILISHLIELFK